MVVRWDEMEITRMRRRMMKEARRSMPELGAGRVRHLVRAFESLLSLSRQMKTVGRGAGKRRKAMETVALPQPPPAAISGEEDYGYDHDYSPEADFAASLESVGESDGEQRRTGPSKKCWIKKLKVREKKPFKKKRTERREGFKEDQPNEKMREVFLEDLKELIHCFIQVSEMKLNFLKSFRMARGLARIRSNRKRRNLTRGLPPGSLATVDDEKANSNSMKLDDQMHFGLNNKLASCKEGLSHNPEHYRGKSLRKSSKWIYFIKGKLEKIKFRLSRWNCCMCGKERYALSNSSSIHLLENRPNKS